MHIRRNEDSLTLTLDEINLGRNGFTKMAFLWDPHNIDVAVNGPTKDRTITPALVFRRNKKAGD